MSLFASLGQHSVAVRDAYVRRLDSRVEVSPKNVEINMPCERASQKLLNELCLSSIAPSTTDL